MLSLFLSFILSCASDIGVTHTIEENVVGDIHVETGMIYNQALDIMFVVDESCSMADDQERLFATMPDVYDVLMGPDFIDLDWRVGIKSTDSGDGGVYAWVDDEDPSAEFQLLTLTTLLGSHHYEAGLDSAIASMAWDTEFHREESDLLVVFISDEPDQSTIPVPDYISLAAQFKTPPFSVSESAIVNTGTFYSEDCNAKSYDVGTGYIDVSEVVVDLCDTTNWINILDYAREHVPTLNEVWYLEEYPTDPATIEVYVNEDPYTDWHYSSSENAVYLDKIPDSGSQVTILYLIWPDA